MRKVSCLLALLVSLPLAGSLQAAVTGFTLSSNTLVDVTVDGQTHAAASLINVTLSDIDDSNAQLILTQGSAVPASGSRAALLSDLRVDTGLANTSRIELTFDTAIKNRSGIDLLIFDLSGFDNDSMTVTFPNTQTSGALNSGNTYQNGTGITFNLASSSDDPTTVAELEAATFSTPQQFSSSATGVAGIDLSNYGYAVGDSISSIVITGSGNLVDPVLVLGIEAVPEPATLALCVIGGLVLVPKRA